MHYMYADKAGIYKEYEERFGFPGEIFGLTPETSIGFHSEGVKGLFSN